MALSEVNIQLFRTINDLGKEYTSLNPVMVFIAEYTIFALVLAILLFWLPHRSKHRMMVICGMITVVLAEIMGKVAGLFHSNNQPFAELANVNQLIEKAVDNSFPSDHTIIFFSICVTFAFFQKNMGLIWFLLACSVGLSRIWVGVHYPADVLVGALVSMIAATFVYSIVPKWDWINRVLSWYEKGETKFLPIKNKSKDF